MFEASKAETKSKVVKSASFGGGRWTVLFYAQSGLDQVGANDLVPRRQYLPHTVAHPLTRVIIVLRRLLERRTTSIRARQSSCG